MSGHFLDSVTFEVGADIGPITKQYAKIDAETDALASRIKTKSSGFFSETQNGSAHLIQMNRAVTDLVNAQRKIKPAAEEAAAGVEKLEQATTRGHGSAATATREFRALFDELTSGRTRQTPGTLAIIATRVFGISGATLAWAAALAAIPAGLALAANSAENAIGRVNRSLVSSGYASGLRSSDIMAGAAELDRTTSLSYEGGRTAMSAFAGSGLAGPLVGRAAAIVPGFGSGTGLTNDKATEELQKLLEDPAKAATELAQQYHLLGVEQQREIKNLADSGDKEKAQSLLLDALSGRFNHLETASWSLATSFDRAGKKFSDFYYHTGDKVAAAFSGRESNDDLQQLAIMRRQMADRASILRGGQGDMLVPYYDANTLPADYDKLRKKVWKEDDDAVRGRAIGQANDAIGTGMSDSDREAGRFNAKLQDLENQLGRDTWALNQAILTHSKYAEEIGHERDAVQTAINNQLDPGQEALVRAAGRRRIAGAPARSRAYVQSEVGADDDRRRALQDPATAQYADTIYSADMSVAGAEQAARSREAIGDTNAAADAALKLAAAYDRGGQAVERQRAANDAHAAWLKGQVINEGAYAAAIGRRGEAEARVAAAEQLRRMREENAGLLAAAGSDGSPAALAAARRHAEAVSATRNLFDTARNPDDMKKAQAALNDYEKQAAVRDNANRDISSKGHDTAIQQQLALTRMEIASLGDLQPLRDKELSDIKVKNELIAEGYAIGSEAYDAEYSVRSKLNDQLRQETTLLARNEREQQNMVDLATQGINEFGRVLNTLTSGHAKWSDIINMIDSDIANLIEKLLILNPLENAATMALTGKQGTLPTANLSQIGNFIGNAVSSIFGGGGGMTNFASAGMHAMGAAYEGGVRYAAQGTVLDRATRFRTAGGPVIGGEAGPEGLLPLARGPDGKLGVHASGVSGHSTIVNQTNNIHPDVSRIARMEAMRAIRDSMAGTFDALRWAQIRGVQV